MIQKILIVGADGYIGSVLTSYLKLTFGADAVYCIDAGLRVNASSNPNETIKLDYRNLKNQDFLGQFTDCVWVAGHSSVLQSVNDPTGCLANNLFGLIEFERNFNGRLIYASSGSVYNNSLEKNCSEDSVLGSPLNIYDYTKSSFDQYLSILGKNFIGLRFGTVIGNSPNIRGELLLNKMVRDALGGGIKLANPNAVRPVLFIKDLVRAIAVLLASEERNEIFNLCSLNGNMKFYADMVSRVLRVPIEVIPNSITYSFAMSNQKFSDRFNFSFEKDLGVIIDDIKRSI